MVKQMLSEISSSPQKLQTLETACYFIHKSQTIKDYLISTSKTHLEDYQILEELKNWLCILLKEEMQIAIDHFN